jgi:hypothetical protein
MCSVFVPRGAARFACACPPIATLSYRFPQRKRLMKGIVAAVSQLIPVITADPLLFPGQPMRTARQRRPQ